jgi:hypothetical protein
MRIAGLLYVTAALAFVAVFGWLAQHFGYPDVLDAPAATVLPALLALGSTGRAVWALYALLPLILIPAAVFAEPMHGVPSRRLGTLSVVLQVGAAVSMMIGLLRWSTAQWVLAEAWPTAAPALREAITVQFDLLNRFLGNGMGEFVGELFLYGAFVVQGTAFRRTGRPRALTVLALATGVSGWVGMFRNVTQSVQPIADVANILLPLYLIVLGGWLLRTGDALPIDRARLAPGGAIEAAAASPAPFR